jgi:NAD(P)-dependent dehydrogenase (short-subunit alcohol dehydrogenase family)
MAMTKALSHELAPHNVLVNAMLVGIIRARVVLGDIRFRG